MNKSNEIVSSLESLDIAAVCNCGLRDNPQGTPNPGIMYGWLNLGYDFRNLNPGVLKAGEVEFNIIDPTNNHDKSIITLHGNDFLKEVSVPVERKSDWLYLLHSCAFGNNGLGTLEWVYADGNKAKVAMETGIHYTGNWRETACSMEYARAIGINDLAGQDAALYAVAIRNPQPDKVVERFVFHCDENNTACWMIFAATTGIGSNLLGSNWREDVTVTIEPDREIGTIRCLHGTNLAAPMSKWKRDINPDLKELDIPIVRLHDAPLENPASQLVDISMVFPLFSADHMNPANYSFEQTDDYITNCLATGTKISYRLGETIETFRPRKNYTIKPPESYEKWAEICCNIIAHYNKGWADGFHYDIEYWPIWEEPHNPSLWAGSWEDYIRLYVITAKKIKQRFPNVKVGGPTAHPDGPEIREFLVECKKQNAPLDFFAWNNYSSHPSMLTKEPYAVRKMLDEYGFEETEIQVAEWNYFAGEWGKILDPHYWNSLIPDIGGANGAAYVCSVLSGWQDTPLDMGNYYAGTSLMCFGLFDQLLQTRHKTYYAMKAFNLMTKYETRVEAKSEACCNTWALAGRKPSGDVAVLISCFKNNNRRIVINFGDYEVNPDQCKVSVIDTEHDFTPAEQMKIVGNTITLEKPVGSAVFLVEIGK